MANFRQKVSKVDCVLLKLCIFHLIIDLSNHHRCWLYSYDIDIRRMALGVNELFMAICSYITGPILLDFSSVLSVFCKLSSLLLVVAFISWCVLGIPNGPQLIKYMNSSHGGGDPCFHYSLPQTLDLVEFLSHIQLWFLLLWHWKKSFRWRGQMVGHEYLYIMWL